MTPTAVNEYKDAMRDAVCPACAYFAPDKKNADRCVHENSGSCSLFAHLDEVVEAVSHVDSGSIEPYLEQLRRTVCANCSHQDESGFCDIRDSHGPIPSWCPLDAYFNLVVGAIEEVQKKNAIVRT